VVSKYIGETEQNLERIFNAAARSNAVLLFNEADSLMGKRSAVHDAHDRYANIEISYLLQKMEQHEGITILTTNLRGNMDDAFLRRLTFTIHFPFPEEESRREIWKRIWPAETNVLPEVDFALLAKRFRLSGGNISNIGLASAFMAAANGRPVSLGDILNATRREYAKVGKDVSLSELRDMVGRPC
jgi:SpoVK/Ycf46/Vps4 family AAA+-type ATPase